MTPKKNRLDTKTVEKIFKEGRFLSNSHLSFKFIETKTPVPPKISFIAPKSIAKLAVKRNLLRRRGYAALKKHLGEFPKGILGVFIFKKYIDDISLLEADVENTLYKMH